MNVQDLDGQFKGKTELIESVNLIMSHFRKFFKEELTNIILHQVQRSAAVRFNNILQDQIHNVRVTDNIFMNTSLTSSPMIKDGLIVIPYDGTVFTDKHVFETTSSNHL